MTHSNGSSLSVTKKEFAPMRVAAQTYTVQDEPSIVLQCIQTCFQAVQNWVSRQGHNLQALLTIGIPTLSNGQLVNYECCVQVPDNFGGSAESESILPSGTVTLKELPGGHYAVLSMPKDSALIGEMIQRFYDEYVPYYNVKIEAERPIYEIYSEDTMKYCVPIYTTTRNLQKGRKPQLVLNDPEHIAIRGGATA